MSQPPANGKTISKKQASKKQDFKGIVKQISTLESKVDLMLESFEKVNKIHMINQLQNKKRSEHFQLLGKVEPSDNNSNSEFTFTPAAFPSMNIDTPILGMNPMTPFNVDKDLLNLNTPKPVHKRSVSPSYNSPSGSPSPTNIKRDTPLNLLADVITNQYEQRLISERIHEDNKAKSASYIKENWNNASPMQNVNTKTESVSSLSSSHTVLNTVTETDFLIEHNWTSLRNNIPEDIYRLFDSIDLNNMYIDLEREKKIYKLLERMQIPKIPTLKIMTKIIDIFLNLNNIYVLLPIETYDLLGILNNWKVDGFNSLNHSHLLLLDAVGSFMCKEIKTTLFTNQENNSEYFIKMKSELEGFENSLTNKSWLDEWEDIFLVNSLLHYQFISMFPDGLASVQGVLLLGLYIKLTGLNLSSSLMQTTAIRICQDLGLHSEKFLNVINKNKRHLIDKKKKLWWFCCFHDEILSIVYSKPRMIIHYTSSIKFLHEGKTKIIEVLENELHREVLLKEAHEKAHKFQDNLDNSHIIENLKTQIQNTIIAIYKEDGISTILKYYFFKIVNIIQNVESTQEKSWDSSVMEQLLDDFIDFSNSLPDIIKDPEGNDVWGDDCFFLYFIHMMIYFVQDHAYQVLYTTDDSQEYIEFMKTNIELITKIKNCNKEYNALFGCYDEILFSRVLRIINYHSNKTKFDKNKAMNDFEMIKTHIQCNLKMEKPTFEAMIQIKDHNLLEQELNKQDQSIQSLDIWLKKKQVIFIKLMVIFNSIIEANSVQ